MEWQSQSTSTFGRFDTLCTANCFSERLHFTIDTGVPILPYPHQHQQSFKKTFPDGCLLICISLMKPLFSESTFISKTSASAPIYKSPPHFLLSSHTGLVAVAWNPQTHFYLGAFELAAPSSLSTLLQDTHTALTLLGGLWLMHPSRGLPNHPT